MTADAPPAPVTAECAQCGTKVPLPPQLLQGHGPFLPATAVWWTLPDNERSQLADRELRAMLDTGLIPGDGSDAARARRYVCCPPDSNGSHLACFERARERAAERAGRPGGDEDSGQDCGAEAAEGPAGAQ